MHGLGQTQESWAAVTGQLSPAIQPSCLSFRERQEGKPLNYDFLYRAMEGHCKKISSPICLCGLSLGAVMALQYTLEHSEQVAALVLIAGQYKMPKKLLKMQSLVFRVLPNKAFEKTGFTKEEFITLTSSMMELDFEQQLSQVACPVLVMCGQKDLANKGAAKRLAQRLPNAKLVWVENSDHEVNRDNPKQLAKEISDFLGAI